MVLIGAGGALFAQTETKFEDAAPSIVDKLKLELDFGASLLSADSEGVVDSMTDAGFDDGGTKIGISYEDELWGASASVTFKSENLRFLNDEIGEMFEPVPLALDELYGWIKPFGEYVKFTAGIFENTDGIADYTDDIDDFGMGVFIFGEDGGVFGEPDADFTGTALKNGFLADLMFGPVTLQVLLGANYSGDSASPLVNGLLGLPWEEDVDGDGIQETVVQEAVDTDERFYRFGGRLIIDAGVGTFAAVFKLCQWPVDIINPSEAMENGMPPIQYSGSTVKWTTFGGYFDFTAVENLGLSVGYTGFLPSNDGADVDSVLYNGIDLRATWTGIEGLSLSTHNNISFAQGSEKDWMGVFASNDASLFTLYNGVGVTKELTDRFSINGQVSNVFSKNDSGGSGKTEYDALGAALKFIANVGDNAEFSVGLRVDVETMSISGSVDIDETVTTFSIPVGIVVSF
jgi:hypothetical protein